MTSELQNSPLDTTENIPPFSEDQTLLRWALQAEAKGILPEEQIAKCMRVPRATTIDVMYDPEHRKAHYAGLVTCHSVWHDPICAAKISERRRVDITRAVDRMNELEFPMWMTTYTIKHGRHDSLSELLTAFLNANDGLRRNKAGRTVKKKSGIIGTIRALEVTYGYGTGWHPHVHEIVFGGNKDIDEEELEEGLWKAWKTETGRIGLIVNRKAFDFSKTKGAVKDYTTKFGREPIKSPWGVEHEVAKAHVKQSRLSDRFTPFGMLLAIYQGHTVLVPRFREYAIWFKGKRQVQWSNGLAKMLLDEEEKTDKELAEEIVEKAYLLGRLTREQWKVVLANDVRGEIIWIARTGDWNQVLAFLIEIGAPVDIHV